VRAVFQQRGKTMNIHDTEEAVMVRQIDAELT
jgi:hypothetical protein